MSDHLDHETVKAVLQDVLQERKRQHALWGTQVMPIHLSGSPYHQEARQIWQRHNDRAASKGSLTWEGVLMEEVSEALSEVNIDLAREEFVQVAAVAVAIIEMIDRERSLKPSG